MIGWSKNKKSNDCIDLNRKAVDKKQVDAVFFFHGGRVEFPQELIKELWLTGIFSDLNQRTVPKLINALKIMKNSDWKNVQKLDELYSGFSKSKIPMNKEELDEFLIKVDGNSNSLIEYEEFMEMMERLINNNKKSLPDVLSINLKISQKEVM